MTVFGFYVQVSSWRVAWRAKGLSKAVYTTQLKTFGLLWAIVVDLCRSGGSKSGLGATETSLRFHPISLCRCESLKD
jgi:hypothetical protein